MRALAVLLLWAALLAAEPEKPVPLEEPRAWRGRIEVEAVAADGSETQKERVDFVAETAPRRTTGGPTRLKLQLRRASGTWALEIDRKKAKQGRKVAQKGSGSGELSVRLTGELDIATGTVVLRPRVQTPRLVARTTVAGVGAGGFGSFRSVASRRACTGSDVEAGKLDAPRRTAKGERTYEDSAEGVARKVTVRWTLERIDPVVRGRVVDHEGKPVAGLRVVASTVRVAQDRPGTYVDRREAKTGDDGRFTIPAEFLTWGVQVFASVDGDIVTAGYVGNDAAVVRFDEVPDLEIRVVRYRLSHLPQSRLLETRFRGDVDRYLDYVTRRYGRQGLSASRATN